MRRPSRLRCRLMDTNPGCRDMKRARSIINDKASACFSGSDSITVICVTGCLSVRMCGMDDLACIGKNYDCDDPALYDTRSILHNGSLGLAWCSRHSETRAIKTRRLL